VAEERRAAKKRPTPTTRSVSTKARGQLRNTTAPMDVPVVAEGCVVEVVVVMGAVAGGGSACASCCSATGVPAGVAEGDCSATGGEVCVRDPATSGTGADAPEGTDVELD
jgi:hypothetical protein